MECVQIRIRPCIKFSGILKRNGAPNLGQKTKPSVKKRREIAG